MKKLQYFFFSFIIVSCTKEIELDLSQQSQKLIINSNFYLDSFITIKLNLSKSIVDNRAYSSVSNATVEIYDKDTNLIELMKNQGQGIYQTLFNKAQKFNKYILKVTYNGKEYWGLDSVPDAPRMKFIDTFRMFFQGQQNYFNCLYSLKDSLKTKEYYGIKVKKIAEKYQLNSLNLIDTIKYEEWIDIETKEFVLTENPITGFSKKMLLYDDKYFNQNIQFLNFGKSNLFANKNDKVKYLIVYFIKMNEGGFNFYNSLHQHVFYQNDPFSQPNPLFGNIPNAYGAFVAQSIVSDTIKFK